MQVQAIPVFRDVHILRKGMLEALSDYAFRADQLLYQGYGNGILSGCRLTTTKDRIILNEGVVFLDGQLILIKEPMETAYHPTNTTTVLKIHVSKEQMEDSLLYREMELLLTEDTELKKGELELCRFKLQEGAKLRYWYQDFEDRSTEFDTLNVIHAAHAARGGSTLSPEITDAFGEEMLRMEELTPLDECFCLQLLGQDQAVSPRMLTAYIERRGRKKLSDRSNPALYQELAQILAETRNSQGTGRGPQQKKRWRMNIE
jgi:hypothetical protein